MTKHEIIESLNRLFLEKQSLSKSDYEKRYNLAMCDPSFFSLMQSKRTLDISIANAQLNNENVEELNKDRRNICKSILNYVESHKIDLNMYYSCPKCQDSGFYNGEMCDCKKSLYVKLLRDNSHLPIDSNFTFDDDKMQQLKIQQSGVISKLYAFGRQFVESFDIAKKRVIFLLGDVGVGKTTLAFAISNGLLQKGKSVYYSTAFDLNNMLVDKQFNRLSNPSLFNDMIDSDFLVIDDLGTEVSNIIGLEYLFSIIDSRISNNKKTMICSNLSIENFSKRYGERATSRLTNKAYSLATTYITGIDLRKI